jgi:hypothetical protein
MPAAFAALEDRVNNAITSRLSNAVFSVSGGAAASGIFTREFVEIAGMASGAPALQMKSSILPASPKDQPIVISEGRGVGNWVIDEVEPDEAGWCTVFLKAAR